MVGAVALALFAAGCGASSDSEELAQARAELEALKEQVASTTAAPTTTTATTTTTTVAPTTTASESAGERNARQSAADYLAYSAFSRSGLIDQLEYEGFTTTQAKYGVDAQGANWNAQAALKAADYLEYSSFFS